MMIDRLMLDVSINLRYIPARRCDVFGGYVLRVREQPKLSFIHVAAFAPERPEYECEVVVVY